MDEIKKIKTHYEEEFKEEIDERVSMENSNEKSMKSKVKDSLILRNSGKKHYNMQAEAAKVGRQRDVVEQNGARKEIGHSKENGEVEDIDAKS